jgi:hypothetical protein
MNFLLALTFAFCRIPTLITEVPTVWADLLTTIVRIVALTEGGRVCIEEVYNSE